MSALEQLAAANGSTGADSPSSEEALHAAIPKQLQDGATFVLNEPRIVPAVWGEPGAPLWAKGEPAMIAGAPGVGKSSLAEQCALRLAGVLTGPLLGLPVERAGGKVLYVAADRPRQIARSMARMVTEADRVALADLLVWRGALPFDLASEPDRMVPFLKAIGGISHVVIDSLSAVSLRLAEDEGGLSIRRALDQATAAGYELAVVHHDRKRAGAS